MANSENQSWRRSAPIEPTGGFENRAFSCSRGRAFTGSAGTTTPIEPRGGFQEHGAFSQWSRDRANLQGSGGTSPIEPSGSFENRAFSMSRGRAHSQAFANTTPIEPRRGFENKAFSWSRDRTRPPASGSTSPTEPTGGFENTTFSWSRNRAHSQAFSVRSTTSTEDLPPMLDLMDGLEGSPLMILPIPILASDDSEEDDVRVKDCTYIGSYNWIESETPTILIPGSPPVWKDRALPYDVFPDAGVHFKDHNRRRIPEAILLPLIEAVNITNKSSPFDWSSVDIITDRNNLRKLTGWVTTPLSLAQATSRNFRIDLQLAGDKTVLMNRWDEVNYEMFSGYTFRYTFEKASTTSAPGSKDATNHHRVVTYDLNGLKMVVRFEADVALPPPASKYPRRSISNVNEITKMMNEARLSRATSVASGRLRIVEGGTEAPSAAVVELTTRSQKNLETNGFDWRDAFGPLFFSQTSQHFLAIHRGGRFVEVQKRDLTSPEFQEVEDLVRVDLKMVRKALDSIKKVVIEHGNEGRLSLVCVNGEMRVYKRTSSESCLPTETLGLFNLKASP